MAEDKERTKKEEENLQSCHAGKKLQSYTLTVTEHICSTISGVVCVDFSVHNTTHLQRDDQLPL